ncbi:hypothetical protein K9L16_03235 [Candidatus Pacearchaeota archaeon]|nr:hypothetical protein [Candidatus Pacearchaeota archaeon]
MLVKKRGSHVGRILSFVIFVTFLIYLYSILQPSIETNREKDFFLNYLENELKENLSIQINMFSVSIIDEDFTDDCAWLVDSYEQTGSSKKVITKDEEENTIETYLHPNKKDIVINDIPLNTSFFKIYYSEDLEEIDERNIPGCGRLNAEDYKIGVVTTKREISEMRIIDFIERYDSEYDLIKERLGVPESINFGIIFLYNNGTTIETPDPERIEDIFAEEHPIQYITSDVGVSSGFLTIKVW